MTFLNECGKAVTDQRQKMINMIIGQIRKINVLSRYRPSYAINHKTAFIESNNEKAAIM